MLNFDNLPLGNEDKAFLTEIRETLSPNCQNEVFLKFKDFPFYLEPRGDEIYVFNNNTLLYLAKNFSDLIYNFYLEGKPFIEQIEFIEYD